jgi:peptidoglycan/LPS O-acetylase OafA/YrhL
VPCLDGLRALSIFFVLAEHASLSHGFPIAHDPHLGIMGRFGVSMFFSISGFLITLLLVREWNRRGTVSLSGFYRRRALRILPAYIAYLLVVFALTRVDYVNLTRTDWLGALTYTVNFISEPSWEIGHVWSLSVEEQFYLAWPFIVLLAAPRRALYVVLAYLAAAPVLRVLLWAFFTENVPLIEQLTPLRLDAIAAGCLLGLLAEKESFRRRVRQTRRQAMGTIAVAATAIGVCVIIGRDITVFDVTVRYTVVALSMTAIIWSAASWPATHLGRILEARPLVFIGVLSYSLYLWQQLFLNPHSTHWTARWPTNIVLALLAAVASYYVVESPFLRIKDRKAVAVDKPAPHIVENEVARVAAQGI